MAFPNNNLKQTAVYWGSPTKDGYGNYTYADPIEIPCRWVDKTEVLIGPNGEELVSHARAQVKQDVDENGLLFLGNLDDLTAAEEADPTTVANARRILKFYKTPTINGRNYFRRAWL